MNERMDYVVVIRRARDRRAAFSLISIGNDCGLRVVSAESLAGKIVMKGRSIRTPEEIRHAFRRTAKDCEATVHIEEANQCQ